MSGRGKNMRKEIILDKNWMFTKPGKDPIQVDLPHTWNALDGQDGGNDYLRTTCNYETSFERPDFDPETEQVYLELNGANASAEVFVNGTSVMQHDGGYSTFRADVTELLTEENELRVKVDNTVNSRVYPQKADFTFYGGIYRPVKLLVVKKNHFDMDHYGGPGVKITPLVKGSKAEVRIQSWITGQGEVSIEILDAEGNVVTSGEGQKAILTIDEPHLWNGVKDPYLYTAHLMLITDGQVMDEREIRFGVRSFEFDTEKRFILNGVPYPLHGVSRHQDRKGVGNAIGKDEHDEDMALIREVGANTIRLAHYQHDQYFYDLCDEYGMVVWAEIPYISEHMPEGRENTISQMKELIIQNYNHPCIVCWGISNEITISTKDHADMMSNHKALNDLCHKMDRTRLTTLACYAMCNPFDSVVHKVSDLVGYNLYLGWYVPCPQLNDLFLGFFHKKWPKRRLCYSEYGAEGMPNLHSETPKRGDHTEEYQAIYHEYMLECFKRHPWMWATYVWNMFDFAADARDQGGEPGMNHKGLVTFDRKTKKDSFYLYKAYWSDEPFVHIASKRFTDRTKDTIKVKVYSNQPSVTLYANGEPVGSQQGEHIFTFDVKLSGETNVRAEAGECVDEAVFKKVSKANQAYTLKKSKSKSANWV